MLESMWSSMSSSMQLAEECLREEEGGSTLESNPVEGIEMFAHAIDSSKSYNLCYFILHCMFKFVCIEVTLYKPVRVD